MSGRASSSASEPIKRSIFHRTASSSPSTHDTHEQRVVRIQFTDYDPTDSSGDEDDDDDRRRCASRRVRMCVNEIIIHGKENHPCSGGGGDAAATEGGNERKWGLGNCGATQKVDGGNVKKYRGVRLRHWGRWSAEIRDPGLKVKLWLGTFATAEEAAMVYDRAAIQLRGADASTNFIKPPSKESELVVAATDTSNSGKWVAEVKEADRNGLAYNTAEEATTGNDRAAAQMHEAQGHYHEQCTVSSPVVTGGGKGKKRSLGNCVANQMVEGGNVKTFHSIWQQSWGEWAAEISDPSRKVRIWLGTYNTAEEAAMAYVRATVEIHGADAYHSFCNENCPVSSTVCIEEEVKYLIASKLCYQHKALSHNKSSNESPKSPSQLQGQEFTNMMISKGERLSDCVHSSVTIKNFKPSQASKLVSCSKSTSKSKGKSLSWGLIWKRKILEDNGSDFRIKNIFMKGTGSHFPDISCYLRQKQYNSDLTYIRCEHCFNWYHGVVVELQESKIFELYGYLCCKRRKEDNSSNSGVSSFERNILNSMGASLADAEWDVHTNGVDDNLTFKCEDLSYEDMEFDPQTSFTNDELLSSDDSAPSNVSSGIVGQSREKSSLLHVDRVIIHENKNPFCCGGGGGTASAGGDTRKEMKKKRPLGNCVATQIMNGGNVKKYRGIRSRSRGKWIAEIRDTGLKTRLWLGTFNTAEEADMAYDRAAIQIHGADALTNLIKPPSCSHEQCTVCSPAVTGGGKGKKRPLGNCISTQMVEGGNVKKYRGIWQQPWGKWAAEIRYPSHKVKTWLGTYHTSEESAMAFVRAAVQIRGADAYHNLNQQKQASTSLSSSKSTSESKGRSLSFGLIWKGKNPEDNGSDFRMNNILSKGTCSGFPDISCYLSQMPYNSELMYIRCEYCFNWYAVAFELEESNIFELYGYHCCKPAKEDKSPQSKSVKLDEKDSDLDIIKAPTKVELPSEKKVVHVELDPLHLNHSRVEQLSEQNSSIDYECSAARSGPQKLPVQLYNKQGKVDHSSNFGVSSFEGNILNSAEESFAAAEWDVNANDVYNGLMFNCEDPSYEGMEFEPQTYFSIDELLASDDGDPPNCSSGNVGKSREKSSPFHGDKVLIQENKSPFSCGGDKDTAVTGGGMQKEQKKKSTQMVEGGNVKKYRGVQLRHGGKWGAEIRDPVLKARLWL